MNLMSYSLLIVLRPTLFPTQAVDFAAYAAAERAAWDETVAAMESTGGGGAGAPGETVVRAMGDLGLYEEGQVVEYPDRGWRDSGCPEDAPDWVKEMYDQVAKYPEEAKSLGPLLEGTGGDPAKIEARARESLEAKIRAGPRPSPLGTGAGDAPPPPQAEMRVDFAERVDSFGVFLWFEFHFEPSAAEQELLGSVLESWFILGRLGGFDAMNMQMRGFSEGVEGLGGGARPEWQPPGSSGEGGGDDGLNFPAAFHELHPPEFRGALAMAWANMGAADDLALDVLLNSLSGFSREYVGIKRVQIGGRSCGGWEAEDPGSMFSPGGLPGVPLEASGGLSDEELERIDRELRKNL